MRCSLGLGTVISKKGDSMKKLDFDLFLISTDELEQKIYKLIVERDSVFYDLTKESLQDLTYQLAVQNNIPHPFKREKAGRAWMEGLKIKKHLQLTYRTTECTARCSAFNRIQVDHFYDNLWTISQHDFISRSNDIYNINGIGVKTSANKPLRVNSIKGKKQVGVIAFAKKG